ncbi:hypothetical protein ACQP0C_20900 [Nocardia sp. CA-129566]|uniref:hypothetical protein n=1 Tax=Nocardia sp. CA-129566 TaxID=3239976 RepID=UPI003D9574C2
MTSDVTRKGTGLGEDLITMAVHRLDDRGHHGQVAPEDPARDREVEAVHDQQAPSLPSRRFGCPADGGIGGRGPIGPHHHRSRCQLVSIRIMSHSAAPLGRDIRVGV